MQTDIVLPLRLGTSPLEKQTFDIEFLSKKKLVSEILDDESPIDQPPNIIKQKKTLHIEEIDHKIKKFEISKLKDQLLVKTVIMAYKKLRNASIYRKITDLKPFQLQILGDKAFFQDLKQKKSLMPDRISRLLDKLVVNPYNSYKMGWNLINFVFFLMIFLFVPLDVSFHSFFDPKMLTSIYTISFFMMILEAIFKLNTAIFLKGCQITDRWVILSSYVTKSLILDICGFFAMIYALSDPKYQGNSLVHAPKLLIFMKFPQFISLYYEILQYFRLLDKSFRNIIDLLKLLLMSLFIAHITACLWHYFSMIGLENDNPGRSWLVSYSAIANSSWNQKYLYSLYWAVVTMMTVGYGDIVPLNNIEMLFTIGAIITGCAVYAYNLSSIGMILQKIYHADQEFNEKIAIINNFMERKNIDKNLNMRVREYLKFMWHEKKARQNEEELEIINSLNEHLKEELLLEAYGGLFKSFPMFYHNFSEKTLKRTLTVMKEVRFMPGDVIFTQRETDDGSIFYINDGEVDLVFEGATFGNTIKLQTLKTGQVFGEKCFFTGQCRDFTAKSKIFTNVFEVKRKDFLDILQEDRDDYEQFSMISDQLIYSQKTPAFSLRCPSCNKLSHGLIQCPLLHYVADKELIVKRLEFSEDQKRFYLKRRIQVKTNSLEINKEVSRQAKILSKNLKKNKQKMDESKLFDTEKSSFFSLEEPSSFNLPGINSLLLASNSSLQNLELENEKNEEEILSNNREKEKQKMAVDAENQESPSKNDDKSSLNCFLRMKSKKLSQNVIKNMDSEDNENLVKNETENKVENLVRFEEKKSSFIRMKSKKDSEDNENPIKNEEKNKGFLRLRSKKLSNNLNMKESLEKKEASNTKTPVFELVFEFESGSILRKYFPKENFDIAARRCERVRRKSIIFRRIQTGNYKPNATVTSELGIIEENNEKFKNLEKYSFYPDLIRAKMSRYLRKKQRNSLKKRGISAKSRNTINTIDETCSPSRKSVFFKRKEFQNKETFSAFVHNVVDRAKHLGQKKFKKIGENKDKV